MDVRVEGGEVRRTQIGMLEQIWFQVKGVQGFVSSGKGGGQKIMDIDFNTYC